MKRRLVQAAAWSALAWSAAAASAQTPGDAVFQGDGGAAPGVGASGPGPAPIVLIKAAGFLFLALTAFVVAFYWWYPRMLERPAGPERRRPRPRAAYGHAWACVLSAVTLAFLAVFWSDLVLTRIFPVPKVPDLVNHWSLKSALLLASVVSFVVVSSHYRSAAPAAGPGR
ncbi:MAG: hypothetical protein U0835_26610 [Isosphaeraceae bacterium]